MEKNKGITLITLVITIIILLILAVVVLNLTLGENGIIKIVIVAKDEYKNAEAKEQQDLEDLYSSILVAGDSKVTLTMQQLNQYIDARVREVGGAVPKLNLEGETKSVNTTYIAETDGIVYIRSVNGLKGVYSYINVYKPDGSLLYATGVGLNNVAYDYTTTIFVPKGCSWIGKPIGSGAQEVKWFAFE